ncbi:MAG TPA: VOC family protein [Deinococcales bacterium]|nr:VOC family protein [Deinococcales bacterium]
MNLRYHHVSRSTADLDRVLAFYYALGCVMEKRVRHEDEGLVRAVLSLPGSDARLQFVQRDSGPVAGPAPDWPDHLAFHTNQVHALVQALLDAGGSLLEEPRERRPGGSIIAFVADPDGHRVELVQKRVS